MRPNQIVYNLAAEHKDNVKPTNLYFDVNVTGAMNICDVAEDIGVKRIIFTSSVAVYGEQCSKMSENAPHNYFNEYGRTKHLAEKVFEEWFRKAPDRALAIVRPTVVFGPGNRGNVYNFLRQMKYGPFVMVGDGSNKKSMAHVSNVAAFLEFLLSQPEKTSTYNYADAPAYSVSELVELVDRVLGRTRKRRLRIGKKLGLVAGGIADSIALLTGNELPISKVRIRKFCSSSEIDASSAFSTGFKPVTKLADGLASMILEQV